MAHWRIDMSVANKKTVKRIEITLITVRKEKACMYELLLKETVRVKKGKNFVDLMSDNRLLSWIWFRWLVSTTSAVGY